MLVQNNYLIVGEEAGWLFDWYILRLRPKVTCICTTLECHLVFFWTGILSEFFLDFPVPSNWSGGKICMIFSVKNHENYTVITSGYIS